jgi:hypothetical protein
VSFGDLAALLGALAVFVSAAAWATVHWKRESSRYTTELNA